MIQRALSMSDYERIEKAIAYLVAHVSEQPSLDDVAAHVHLSPFHFQRLFCQWAGTTPKRFLQVLTLERSKMLLAESRSLLDVSQDIGLSGSSRLHDHFVQLEAVTPGEHKQQGKDVQIDYGVHDTPFGALFVAQTSRGICRASFIDFSSLENEILALQTAWPFSQIKHNAGATQYVLDAMFHPEKLNKQGPLSVYVSGTNFQIAVWRALLNIPSGVITSYSHIATAVGRPQSSRAVANAIGANPIAFLIPCHRVIRQSGALGGYRWGISKKQIIQTWEQLQLPEQQV